MTGEAARQQATTNPARTISGIKRLLECKYDTDLKKLSNIYPYPLVKTPDGFIGIQINGRNYSAPELAATILAKIKKDAEACTGESVTEAVVAVPASFNAMQRQAIKDACRIAGLDARRLIDETTAVAGAYAFGKDDDQTIAILDIGAGKCEISILQVGDGVVEVISTLGDSLLGGEDFDQSIVNYLVEEFRKETGIDLSHDTTTIQRLKEAAAKAKNDLSTIMETEINVPYIKVNQGIPQRLLTRLSRSTFENIVSDLILRINELIFKTVVLYKKSLADHDREYRDINKVLLVGGMSRMPLVQKIVGAAFPNADISIIRSDDAVAMGAAIQGGILAGDVGNILYLAITTHSLGIETSDGVFTKFIDRNTTIPTRISKIIVLPLDEQKYPYLNILQGESPKVYDNVCIARYTLKKLQKANASDSEFEVSFDIDANNLINVSIKNVATDEEESFRLTTPGLSEEEIQRLIKETQTNDGTDNGNQDAGAELIKASFGLFSSVLKTWSK